MYDSNSVPHKKTNRRSHKLLVTLDELVVDSPQRSTYVPRGFVLRTDTQVLSGRRFLAFP